MCNRFLVRFFYCFFHFTLRFTVPVLLITSESHKCYFFGIWLMDTCNWVQPHCPHHRWRVNQADHNKEAFDWLISFIFHKRADSCFDSRSCTIWLCHMYLVDLWNLVEKKARPIPELFHSQLRSNYCSVIRPDKSSISSVYHSLEKHSDSTAEYSKRIEPRNYCT